MHTLRVCYCVFNRVWCTMTLNRCECCRGQGIVKGLGGMERDCGGCHGVGHVKVVVEPVAEPIVEPVVVVKRKRRTPAEMLADADKGE